MALALVNDFGTVTLTKNTSPAFAPQALPAGFLDFVLLVTQAGGAWTHGGAVAANVTISVSYDGGVTYLLGDVFTDVVVDEASPAVVKNSVTIWPANSARIIIGIDPPDLPDSRPTTNLKAKASAVIGGVTRQASVQFWGDNGQ